LSSRNRFLAPAERDTAPVLFAALTAASWALSGGTPAEVALAEAQATLRAAGFDVDYFALVDGPSLAPLAAGRPGARLVAAARLGTVRLLDNIAAL
jgi:pantoate--beta-alanine ligase